MARRSSRKGTAVFRKGRSTRKTRKVRRRQRGGALPGSSQANTVVTFTPNAKEVDSIPTTVSLDTAKDLLELED